MASCERHTAGPGMKRRFAIALRVAIILAVVLAVVPEFSRYRGEHRLYQANALFRAMLDDQTGSEREEIFNAALTSATEAAHSIPGDSRPLIVAGSLYLFPRRPAPPLG